MNSAQHLYYALGQLAYAVAMADGKLQKEEKDRFHKLMMAEAGYDIDFDYGYIIFRIMEKDQVPLDVAYKWAMKEMEMNRHHFAPGMKKKFTEVIEEVAKAFPPEGNEERQLIAQFRHDVAAL